MTTDQIEHKTSQTHAHLGVCSIISLLIGFAAKFLFLHCLRKSITVPPHTGGIPLLRAASRVFLWRSIRRKPTGLSLNSHQRSLAYNTTEDLSWAGLGGSEGSRQGIDGEKSRERVTPPGVPRRIHILGLGSLGKLVAFHLASIPNRPPISILFHRASTRAAWVEAGQAIEVERDEQTDRRTGFDAESGARPATEEKKVEQSQKPIYNLIVTLKGPVTAGALASIAHRLTADSTIVFLQNGLGILDELDEKVFPNPDTRPSYMAGIVTHGAHSKSQFKTEHAGLGTIALSVLPKASSDGLDFQESELMALSQSSRYLLRTLTRTPSLAALGYPYQELFQLQLEKLAVNAVVNPITAILGCYNGELLHGTHATRLMRLLLAEISLVIRNLPDLQGLPNVEARFSSERLEHIVVGMLQTTARNLSSMLQDVRKSQVTEIAYINGWFVKKGEELGLRCIVNYAVMQLLETKSWMTFKRESDRLPFEDPE